MMRRDILIGGALALAGGATYAVTPQMGPMKACNGSVAAMRAALAKQPEVRDLVRFATLTANGHNTQP